MRRYYKLVELARICSRQARITQTEQVARTLRRMAREYVQEAAKLDGGKIPDIGLVCLKQARQGHANLPDYIVEPRPCTASVGRGQPATIGEAAATIGASSVGDATPRKPFGDLKRRVEPLTVRDIDGHQIVEGRENHLRSLYHPDNEPNRLARYSAGPTSAVMARCASTFACCTFKSASRSAGLLAFGH